MLPDTGIKYCNVVFFSSLLKFSNIIFSNKVYYMSINIQKPMNF